MKNIIHYVQETLDTFDVRPFTDVDSLVLSCLSFLNIPAQLKDAHSWRGIRLAELYRAEHFHSLFLPSFTPERTRQLLTAAAASPRFRDIRVMGYESKLDERIEKQFSAVTYRLMPRLSYIAFRGTDGTVVGWKEDFNMTYRSPIPSQEDAIRYVNRAGRHCPGQLLMGGHSKGGNLAIYAAAFCRESLQERLQRVYSHDGPGFLPHVLESLGYRRVVTRVEKTLPQSSVVGLLLDDLQDVKLVKSHGVSLLQHDPFTWEVQEGDFVPAGKLTLDARHLERTLSAWLMGKDDAQRQELVDALFGILETTDIRELSQFRSDWRKTIPAVAKELARLEPATREVLWGALKDLAVISIRSFPETLKKERK